MKPVKVVGIRRSFLKPEEIGKGRVMGIWKFLTGLWPGGVAEQAQDDAQRRTIESAKRGGPTWDIPCSAMYGEYANALIPCEKCGHLIGAHKRCAAVSQTFTGEPETMAAHRAPRNQHGQLILAGEVPQRTARELVETAGNSVPALATAMGLIAQRFEDSVRSSDQLNRALGEFKEQVVGPFREELRFLRFNLGDKVNQTTTNLEVMVAQLRTLIGAELLAKGVTPEGVQKFLVEHGIDRAPSGEELEIHVAEHQELLKQVEALTAQNQRLLAMLNAKHVQWPEDGGNWVYHEGCLCEECRKRSQATAMQQEASGEARSRSIPVLTAVHDKKPPAKAPDRRKRRGS